VKTRVAMLALLVVLTSCGASSASSSPAPSAGSSSTASSTSTQSASTTTDTPNRACGPANATTLASDAVARVYSVGQAVYGCTAQGGRRFQLGDTARSLREGRAGPIAVAGTVAAYGFTRFGVDTVSTEVMVRRLTDGAVFVTRPATNFVGVESFQSVGSIVVNADGTVAWIGSDTSIIAHRARDEVHVVSGGSDAVLDSGTGIDVTSLRLEGSALSWRDGGRMRHAALH
jgi:hypothetical protein